MLISGAHDQILSQSEFSNTIVNILLLLLLLLLVVVLVVVVVVVVFLLTVFVLRILL